MGPDSIKIAYVLNGRPLIQNIHGITQQSEVKKIRKVLKVDPQCHDDARPLAQKTIRDCINPVYDIVNASLSE